MRLETALGTPPPSYARVREPSRPPLRVGAVQHRWHPDPAEHEAALAEGIRLAAEQGATLVCLQELTLSPYFAITPDGPQQTERGSPAQGGAGAGDAAAGALPGGSGGEPEDIPDGPTCRFAARMAAATGAYVHASLYERHPDGGLGYNTAVVLSPDGSVVARTRKLHIPVTAGYYEDKYFRPGDDEKGYP